MLLRNYLRIQMLGERSCVSRFAWYKCPIELLIKNEYNF